MQWYGGTQGWEGLWDSIGMVVLRGGKDYGTVVVRWYSGVGRTVGQ